MPIKNALLIAPPHHVERALKQLGANLRTARVRRKMTLQNAGEKIGVSRFVVAAAEEGKPSTAVVTYMALLWAYGLLDQFGAIADPSQDKEGMALSIATDQKRVRAAETLDNDF